MTEPQNAPVLVPELEEVEGEELESEAPDLAEIDPSEIVEAAEQLLREGAPHDFDLLVIGGGPGGYSAALRAAQLGAHVGLVEEREVGGVCVNRGCIPTKTLLESVGVLRTLRRAKIYGIETGEIRPDFSQMHARKREVVAYLRDNVTRLLEEDGVEILPGRARFIEEHTVEVAGRTITAVDILIATGGRPARLPIPGADLPGVVTSDEVLEQTFVPQKLVVAGAGAVGVEFAALLAELGAKATILEMSDHVLPHEDEDVQAEMQRSLERDGVDVVLDAKITRVERDGDELFVVFEQGGAEKRLVCDQILMAAGRLANIEDLGLEDVGIEVQNGAIWVDEALQTSVGGVFAVGDCIRRVGWAHQAALEGREVAERILGHAHDGDTRFVPSCYYTHPEVASVGLTLREAQEKGIEARAGTFFFRSNGRAAVAGEHEGFVKLVFEVETEQILGCQIIGPRATDLIGEAALALRNRQTLDEIIGTIHAHPTFAEALPEAALAARARKNIWECLS